MAPRRKGGVRTDSGAAPPPPPPDAPARHALSSFTSPAGAAKQSKCCADHCATLGGMAGGENTPSFRPTKITPAVPPLPPREAPAAAAAAAAPPLCKGNTFSFTRHCRKRLGGKACTSVLPRAQPSAASSALLLPLLPLLLPLGGAAQSSSIGACRGMVERTMLPFAAALRPPALASTKSFTMCRRGVRFSSSAVEKAILFHSTQSSKAAPAAPAFHSGCARAAAASPPSRRPLCCSQKGTGAALPLPAPAPAAAGGAEAAAAASTLRMPLLAALVVCSIRGYRPGPSAQCGRACATALLAQPLPAANGWGGRARKVAETCRGRPVREEG